MTVDGTNFVPTSVVNFDGSARTTTFVSATQLSAVIVASDLSTAGAFSITVSNPSPEGGTSNAQSFTVEKATPTINVTGGSFTYNGASHPATAAATGVSGGSVSGTFSYTYNGSSAEPLNVGSYAVVASFTSSDSNYKDTTGSGSVTITIASQTISFGALSGKTYGDADFPVSASASSGLAVSFTATGNCTVTGNSVHLSGAGSCTVTAHQGGDPNWNPAPDVSQSFNIGKASQTISFGSLSGKTYGDADFPVSASASSGLAVSFSIVSGPATISDNTITITGVGAVTVRASQGGDANYNPATSVDRSFTVAKATPLITWNNPAEIIYGTALSGTQLNATASVPGTFVYTPAAGMVLGAGSGQTLSVSFTPTDTGNYNTNTATVQINVLKANQTISFGPLSDKTYGDVPFSVSAAASSGLAVSFSIVSGPATSSDNTITITGVGIVTVRAFQGGDANYNAATPVDQSFSVTAKVLLKAGQNLVSFPTIAGEIPITELLSSISGEYEMVYFYEGCDPVDPWKIYDPDLPSYANNLQYVDSAMGIWIEATQDTELTIEGVFPSSLSIPLCAGWNLISYAEDQAKPVEEALSSISGKYQRVYSYRADNITDPWKIYDVSVPSWVNDLTTMEPGLGYWIYINENCTLAINN